MPSVAIRGVVESGGSRRKKPLELIAPLFRVAWTNLLWLWLSWFVNLFRALIKSDLRLRLMCLGFYWRWFEHQIDGVAVCYMMY
jgi:hypothetical protein